MMLNENVLWFVRIAKWVCVLYSIGVYLAIVMPLDENIFK